MVSREKPQHNAFPPMAQQICSSEVRIQTPTPFPGAPPPCPHTHIDTHTHHVPSHFPFVCIRSISKGLKPNVSTRRRASFSCPPPTSPSLARSGGQSSRHKITLKGAFLPQRWRRRCGWCWSDLSTFSLPPHRPRGAAVARMRFSFCVIAIFFSSLPRLTASTRLCGRKCFISVLG